MDLFPSLQALVGGILIGAGAAVLLVFNGRAASVSTVAGALLRGPLGRAGPRLGFLGGILLAPLVCSLAGFAVPRAELEAPLLLVLAAGFLVGFGSRLGDGSCSGHAVCGLARFARRSLVATVLFLVCAVAAVYVRGHVVEAFL